MQGVWPADHGKRDSTFAQCKQRALLTVLHFSLALSGGETLTWLLCLIVCLAAVFDCVLQSTTRVFAACFGRWPLHWACSTASCRRWRAPTAVRCELCWRPRSGRPRKEGREGQGEGTAEKETADRRRGGGWRYLQWLCSVADGRCSGAAVAVSAGLAAPAIAAGLAALGLGACSILLSMCSCSY